MQIGWVILFPNRAWKIKHSSVTVHFSSTVWGQKNRPICISYCWAGPWNETAIELFPQAVDLKPFTDAIRVKNPEIGFRLVKLRAEAKMLEKLCWGMCIAVFSYSVLAIVRGGSNKYGLMIALCLLLCFAFWANQKRHGRNTGRVLQTTIKYCSQMTQK